MFPYFSFLSISSHSLIHFPTFQYPSLPLFIILLFLPLNKLKLPHSFSYLSMNPHPPHSFSYFFYLSKSFHSRIHFPTFQWASIPPFIFLLLLPFNELPFRNAEFFLLFISYFSYWIHFLTFPTFSISSPSPIHFSTFHTFQWALIPLFIFLVFLPFIELPFPYSFSYFSYRTFQ